MPVFLLRRFLGLVTVLFCVVSITFLLIRITPGGPFEGERGVSVEVKEAFLKKHKLDGSLAHQYIRYMGDLLRGDLRESLQYKNLSVKEILGQTLPVSFTLGGIAFVIATLGGVFLGTIAAVRKDSWLDISAMLIALLAISIPAFVTGPLLILVFALKLGWFPVGGWFSIKSMVLPAIALAAPYVAYIARLMRNSTLEVLRQDYIRTARAKGVSATSLLYKHALKVAILPVVTFLGPLAANLLTGSIVVESIFSIPGAGRFFVSAIENRDGFMLCGVVVIYCLLLVVFNFLVDIAYTLLDRRIKLYGN